MKKIIKWIAIVTIAFLSLGFLFVWLVLLATPPAASSLQQINDNELHTVVLGGKSMCSDGSPYSIYVRKGKSENLIIHFSGGGACWDGATCSAPVTLMSLIGGDLQLKAYYVPKIYKFIPHLITGLLDNRAPNPFKDWNIVYIPYCTGDLHVGNAINSYNFNNKEFKIHHNGRNNSLAALQWTFNNFKIVNKVMVSGESAGGFASAFWAPVVANQYNNSRIYQLSDASMLHSSRWREIMDTVWKAESSSYLNFQIGKDVYESALLQRKDSLNYEIKHLHSNTVFDAVLTRFSAALNNTSTTTNDFIDDWSLSTLASMKKLAESGLDYEYFLSSWQYDSITHTTPHVLSGVNFNNCISDQVSFSDWLKRNVIDDEPISVGDHFLNHRK